LEQRGGQLLPAANAGHTKNNSNSQTDVFKKPIPGKSCCQAFLFIDSISVGSLFIFLLGYKSISREVTIIINFFVHYHFLFLPHEIKQKKLTK